MDYMYFKESEERSIKAKRFYSMPIESSRSWDLETLEHYGLVDEMYDIISHPYFEDNFVDEGLWNLFRQTSTIYKELLIEFLASFHFEDGPQDANFNTRQSITFRLGEKWHKTSLIGFAKFLGIVDRNHDERVYKAYLDKATVGTPPGFDLFALWEEVGMNTYDPRLCFESDLASPLCRLTHRFLATTILFHPQQDLVNVQQLKGLWYILHHETRWNLPHAMALMFKNASDERFDKLPGGQFVTHMAIHLGVLDHYAMYACDPMLPVPTGLPFFVQIMLLKKLKGDKYRLYKKREPKEEDNMNGASTSRTYEEFDASNIHNKLDHLGWYIDDLNRQNASTRNIPLMPLWNDRMGYNNEESKGSKR